MQTSVFRYFEYEYTTTEARARARTMTGELYEDADGHEPDIIPYSLHYEQGLRGATHEAFQINFIVFIVSCAPEMRSDLYFHVTSQAILDKRPGSLPKHNGPTPRPSSQS